MHNRLEISTEAISDLEDIWFHIAQDSVHRADQFIEKLHAKCIEISEINALGRPREDLLPELKSLPFKKYAIFFYRNDANVQIVRALHGSRDIFQTFDSNDHT